MFYGIKDGKVWDKCNREVNKRTKDNGVPMLADYYIEIDDKEDYTIGDSYNNTTKIITKDSLIRFKEPEKTPEQIKLKELEERIIKLEGK